MENPNINQQQPAEQPEKEINEGMSKTNESDNNDSEGEERKMGVTHVLNGVFALVLAIIFFFIVESFSVLPPSSTDAFKYILILPPLAVISGFAGFILSLISSYIIGVVINRKYRDISEEAGRKKKRFFTKIIVGIILVSVFIFYTTTNYMNFRDLNKTIAYGVKYDKNVVERVDIIGEHVWGLSELTDFDPVDKESGVRGPNTGIKWEGTFFTGCLRPGDQYLSCVGLVEADTSDQGVEAQFTWNGSRYKIRVISKFHNVIIEDSTGRELINLHPEERYPYITQASYLPVSINGEPYLFLLVDFRATSRRSALYVFDFEDDYELLYEELVGSIGDRYYMFAMEGINDTEKKIIFLGIDRNVELPEGGDRTSPLNYPGYIIR